VTEILALDEQGTGGGSRGLYGRLRHEVNAAGLTNGPRDESKVEAAEVADLPPAAQRFFDFAGVVGRPRVWSFRAALEGRFRLRTQWLPALAWQYDSNDDPARIFVMRLRLAGLPLIGRDLYLRGHGRMVGKLLDLVKVVDGQGDEFDISELVTYLNDLVLLAPSMLLRPGITFDAVDDSSFDVSLTDAGHTVRARVFIDERGAPYDFSTTDRYADLPGGLVRAEWRTPIEGWNFANGSPVPGPVTAVWHLPSGPRPYLTARLTHLAYNVPAGF
jgi:hypothetical protein